MTLLYESKNKDIEKKNQICYLLKFDWDGNLKKGFKMDRKIRYFAIDEKPSETILPYIVDKSQFPPEYKLAFANIDWLTIEEHPIEPKLVDDLLKLLGRERSKPQLFLNRKFSITNFIFEAVQAYIAARSACRTITNKFKYDHIGLCYEGRTIVKKHNKYGYINEVGTIAIPLLFDSAEDFHNGKAKVILNDEVFYIDKNGNRVK